MNVLTRMDDADAGANTLDLPFRFYPCLAAGLAYYISLKKAPERTSMLKAVYEEGESNPTNEECGSVTNPEDFSVIGIAEYYKDFIDYNKNEKCYSHYCYCLLSTAC